MSRATKIFKTLFVLILMVNGAAALAQTTDFVVYLAAGKASKVTGGKVIPLKKGDNLYFTDKLNVEKNARVILICKNSNVITLKDSGLQNLKAAAAQCARQADEFSSSYFRFIFDEFTQNGAKINEQNYLNNLGAVSRGWPVMNVFLDTINYYDGEVKIMWRDKIHAGTVTVFSDPKAENVIKKITYTHNIFLPDSLTAGLRSPGTYYWNISNSINQTSPLYVLRLMDKTVYQNGISSILKNVVKTTPAETAYMSGFLLEKNHFLAKAAEFYKQATLLEPGNPVYRKTKIRFYE